MLDNDKHTSYDMVLRHGFWCERYLHDVDSNIANNKRKSKYDLVEGVHK